MGYDITSSPLSKLPLVVLAHMQKFIRIDIIAYLLTSNLMTF